MERIGYEKLAEELLASDCRDTKKTTQCNLTSLVSGQLLF